jgi:hypothetical protein
LAEDTVSWSSLFGYFGEADAINFVRGRGVRLDAEAEEKLAGEVAAARRYVSTIGGRGLAAPRVEEFPNGQSERLALLRQSPEFSEFVSGAQSWSFGMVELAKLRVYQPHINLEYARKMIRSAPASDDVEATVSYRLPLKGETPEAKPTMNYDGLQKTYSLVTESPDMRVLGSVKIEYAANRMGKSVSSTGSVIRRCPWCSTRG